MIYKLSTYIFVLGSSTACVVILNRENSTLYTANIGDSGFMVVRHGRVIHKSEEQQHYFNTPFQLSLPPPGYQQNVLSDQPDSAITNNFPVEDGDVILIATDGVFDNLPQNILVEELCKVNFDFFKNHATSLFLEISGTAFCCVFWLKSSTAQKYLHFFFFLFKVQGERSVNRLQNVANSIAWMARNLSFDETFISPFAESAFANGINTIGKLILNKYYTILGQLFETGFKICLYVYFKSVYMLR